jgi:hypothetical protein
MNTAQQINTLTGSKSSNAMKGVNRSDAQVVIEQAEPTEAEAIAMTTKKDRRFTVTRECCGHATPQFVARFCGDWIGSATTEFDARELCDKFNANRF